MQSSLIACRAGNCIRAHNRLFHSAIGMQGVPFSVAGCADLLALFRCVSCRYKFGTDTSKPVLMVSWLFAALESSDRPKVTCVITCNDLYRGLLGVCSHLGSQRCLTMCNNMTSGSFLEWRRHTGAVSTVLCSCLCTPPQTGISPLLSLKWSRQTQM